MTQSMYESNPIPTKAWALVMVLESWRICKVVLRFQLSRSEKTAHMPFRLKVLVGLGI